MPDRPFIKSSFTLTDQNDLPAPARGRGHTCKSRYPAAYMIVWIPAFGLVAKLNIWRLRLLRFARNDKETHFLSLRGAKRRSNLGFGNRPFRGNDNYLYLCFSFGTYHSK